MKLLVIGAGGRTGSRLVAGGVARGHQVTAGLHRPGTPLPVACRHVACDVLAPGELDMAATGQDVVLVAVSSRVPLCPGTFFDDAARNVVRSLQHCGVPRLIWLSSVGTGPAHDPNLPPHFTRLLQPLVYRALFEQFEVAEATVAGSDLDWTIVHAPRLTNGDATGRYRTEEGHSLPSGHSISRRDVADFVLKELELRRWSRRHVAIAY